MAELRYFLVSSGESREASLRKRLHEVGQSNFVGTYRVGESPGDFEAILEASRVEVLVVDASVPPAETLDMARRARARVPLVVTVVLMPEKDFDFLEACVQAGVDLTKVEPADLVETADRAEELRRAKVREAHLRRMAGEEAPVDGEGVAEVARPAGGTVLAFVSAKDGEGKSTVALNLALTLGRRFGLRAIYVDLGETLSETGMMMNATPPATYLKLLENPRKLSMERVREAAIDYFEDGSALAICGNATIEPPAVDRDALDLLIRFLRTQCDFLILDCPVQFCDNLKIALRLADWHVAVVQNTLSSLRNARIYLAELRRLEYPQHQVRVVLNRVSRTAGLSQEDLTRNLDPYPIVCGIVSNGPVAIEAINIGVPVVVHAPEADLTLSIQNLAKALLGIESSDVLSASSFSLSSIFSIFGK